MRKRGDNGTGSIDRSGEGAWRLRYRINGRRFAVHFKGTKAEATKELRRLLKSGDDGQHIAPSKLTLKEWATQWLALKERSLAGQTLDRYRTLLETHVIPALGTRLLQKIGGHDIDILYGKLTLGSRTRLFLHVVLKSCFASATKKKLITTNPVADAEKPAGTDDEEVGIVLDEGPLATLVAGFKRTSLYAIVATAAYTGMRKGEVLALRWIDIDLTAKTISVSRNVEDVYGSERKLQRGVKRPKTKRGIRTFEIDDQLCNLLRREREVQLRLVAGLPDGADVDLSLIRLPKDALCFPAIGTDMTELRSPGSVYVMFKARAKELGFGMRFHDLRGTHSTILLDKGVPVHVVAKRIGDDPATLLRHYAKRTKKADTSAANVIGTLTTGLGS